MKSGIYVIHNTVSGSFYLGSSVNVSKRLSGHRTYLAAGRHPNRHLLRSWLKHGEAAFVLEQIVECESGSLRDTEQRLLDALVGHPQCLNIARDAHAPTRGIKLPPRSAEHRAQISARLLGKKLSPERCARLSELRQGRPAWNKGRRMSDHQRKRMSEVRLGKPGHPCSEAARAKIGAANRGKPNAWTGKTRSLESRQKMSKARAGRVVTSEQRARLRDANVGKRASDETRARMSESQRQRWADRRRPVS